jgi:transposase-like protein
MQDMTVDAMIPELRRVLKRLHYPLEVMLVCARWHAAFPLSFRHLEEMMQERGVFVDHSTVYRWALKILPVMALIFRRRKRPIGNSWRMDETYFKVAGQWKYLYRAVDKCDDTVDCPDLMTSYTQIGGNHLGNKSDEIQTKSIRRELQTASR